MKIVLDTTVFISGLLKPFGFPATLLRLILGGMVALVVDGRILQEYEETARRPKFGIDPDRLEVVLGQIRMLGEMVLSRPLNVVLPDPDDLIFLEAAVSAGADAIVTGNKRHFPRSKTGSMAIWSPREALGRIASEG